ncbi:MULTISPECIES: hypothetical protein [Cryobacterium]|uniref:Uncharacterized protein n=1 Tax=Cryobacterium breve TaxID=1259258 RepID=A0ABY2J1I0_9MICO|nr:MULTISPECIES: hypothetical protein [Cryobacterium]TFC96737.1 hypothetical protein E3T20_01680 [Cryobacterium sp. TmT3-12]TFC97466.1 hypothetical protein E3O65_11820 [Cryobacterium breve]
MTVGSELGLSLSPLSLVHRQLTNHHSTIASLGLADNATAGNAIGDHSVDEGVDCVRLLVVELHDRAGPPEDILRQFLRENFVAAGQGGLGALVGLRLGRTSRDNGSQNHYKDSGETGLGRRSHEIDRIAAPFQHGQGPSIKVGRPAATL